MFRNTLKRIAGVGKSCLLKLKAVFGPNLTRSGYFAVIGRAFVHAEQLPAHLINHRKRISALENARKSLVNDMSDNKTCGNGGQSSDAFQQSSVREDRLTRSALDRQIESEYGILGAKIVDVYGNPSVRADLQVALTEEQRRLLSLSEGSPAATSGGVSFPSVCAMVYCGLAFYLLSLLLPFVRVDGSSMSGLQVFTQALSEETGSHVGRIILPMSVSNVAVVAACVILLVPGCESLGSLRIAGGLMAIGLVGDGFDILSGPFGSVAAGGAYVWFYSMLLIWASVLRRAWEFKRAQFFPSGGLASWLGGGFIVFIVGMTLLASCSVFSALWPVEARLQRVEVSHWYKSSTGRMFADSDRADESYWRMASTPEEISITEEDPSKKGHFRSESSSRNGRPGNKRSLKSVSTTDGNAVAARVQPGEPVAPNVEKSGANVDAAQMTLNAFITAATLRRAEEERVRQQQADRSYQQSAPPSMSRGYAQAPMSSGPTRGPAYPNSRSQNYEGTCTRCGWRTGRQVNQTFQTCPQMGVGFDPTRMCGGVVVYTPVQ